LVHKVEAVILSNKGFSSLQKLSNSKHSSGVWLNEALNSIKELETTAEIIKKFCAHSFESFARNPKQKLSPALNTPPMLKVKFKSFLITPKELFSLFAPQQTHSRAHPRETTETSQDKQ
jgi:hypothetical protein